MVKSGKRVVIAAHGNSLRALGKSLYYTMHGMTERATLILQCDVTCMAQLSVLFLPHHILICDYYAIYS